MKKLFWGITWAAMEYMFLLPVFIGAVILLFVRFKKARRAITLLARSGQSSLLRNTSVMRQLFKTVLLSISVLFLFLALLRPQWDKREQQVEQKGRDLLIAFDISRSMLVQDSAPNRLKAAKAKVRALLDLLESERVGLILFSGSTCVQCPLTTDYAAFYMFLDQLDVETISSGTTAIDQAIKQALRSFGALATRKNKLLVLFTDGEDFSSDLAGIRSQASKEGLTIFALGVGTPDGGPIPIVDDSGQQIGHQKDQKGKIIISRLNEGILHNLAEQTGGKYLRCTADDSDIKTLVRLVQKFEKEQFEDKKIETLEDRYPYFLVVSFVCLALEWLL